MVEIFGKEASGKTTLALHIVKEAQKNGGLSFLYDALFFLLLLMLASILLKKIQIGFFLFYTPEIFLHF